MEYLLLETVEWRIRVPSAFTFLQHFLHCVAHAPTAGVLPRDTAAAQEFRRQASFLAVGATWASATALDSWMQQDP